MKTRALFAGGALAGAAMAAPAVATPTQCASFGRFHHDQMLANGTRVGDFIIGSIAGPGVRVYDPHTDGAPKGLTGVMVDGQGIEIRLAKPTHHQRARVVYVSDSKASQRLTLTRADGAGVVPQVRLPATPQNTRLELVNAAPLATRGVFEGHELIVARFCLEK